MDFLITEPAGAVATVMLAHGAGAPMDSPFLERMAAALAQHGLACARFEFAYMAARRTGAPARPPPRAERLMAAYTGAIADARSRGLPGNLLIGGKSLGGRVATMIGQAHFNEGRIGGIVCLGYPFHPPAHPDRPRTAYLETLTAPTLICQGTRDPFGRVEEVATYALSSSVTLNWLEDGDHNLNPRRASGHDQEGHINRCAAAIREWVG